MEKLKKSLIVTFLNEEATIKELLDSIVEQTILPDEIVLVDGGSTDSTTRIVREFLKENKKVSDRFKLLNKPGNRSIGRNYGVEHTHADLILFTDAGCILDKNWVKNISLSFKDKTVDVVAGYYKGKAVNNFQKALIPYVLAMPDRVNPNNFLPATRSMAIRKKVFDEMNGFDEKLSHNEDYAFAKKLTKKNRKIVFEKDAIVYWIPRNSIGSSFAMFSRFAYGDIESGIIRPKVVALFARYIIGLILLVVAFLTGSVLLWILLVLGFILYCVWAIWKNYRYVKNSSALFYLPLLQFISDIAVLTGSTRAFLTRIKHG